MTELSPSVIYKNLGRTPWDAAVTLYSLASDTGYVNSPLAVEITDDRDSRTYIAVVEDGPEKYIMKKVLIPIALMVVGVLVHKLGLSLLSFVVILVGCLYSFRTLMHVYDDEQHLAVLGSPAKGSGETVRFVRSDDILEDIPEGVNVSYISSVDSNSDREYSIVSNVFNASLCQQESDWYSMRQVAASIEEFGRQYMVEVKE